MVRMNYDMKQRDFRCFGAIWGQFVSKDSDQTEAAPRKFKLGPLGSLNQVTKGLAKTIRATVRSLARPMPPKIRPPPGGC